MIIRLTVEETGWPVRKNSELSETKTVSELVETLVREGALPETGEHIYLLHKASTDEEMAVYYPFVKKVILLRENKRTLRSWFPESDEGEIRVQTYSGWEQRLSELDPDGIEMQKEERKTGKEEEADTSAWGPREKELTLLKLMKSLGTDAGEPYAKAAGWELWLYLLGFVLVMAFLVSSLTAFISGNMGGKELYQIIGNRALYFLIPAGLCFAAGKLSEVIAKKKKK